MSLCFGEAGSEGDEEKSLREYLAIYCTLRGARHPEDTAKI